VNARTILTLANRKGIDLLQPTPADYADFEWQAEHLAKEKRYNGATPGVEYSVAEHSVRGAQAILEAEGHQQLAAYFLLHDVHEAVIKDDTTPKKRALAAIAEEQFGTLASVIMEAFASLEARHDEAIHAAAGLPWPVSPDMRTSIKLWDLRMLVTEWRDLMLGAEHPDWSPYEWVVPLPGVIVPWGWSEARARWLSLAHRLLPALAAATAEG
jgi:hypothetical protein